MPKKALLFFAILIQGILLCFPANRFFKELTIRIDTVFYQYPQDTININKICYLPFAYSNEEEIINLTFKPTNNNLLFIRLLESSDFRILDTLRKINNDYYSARIQFINLTRSDQITLTFSIKTTQDSSLSYRQFYLFPVTQTTVQFKPLTNDLYIGEEIVYELFTNNPFNIKQQNIWATTNNIDYRITEKFGQLRLHLVPNELGTKQLKIKLQTIRPWLNEKGKLIYDLPELNYEFNVKKGRLQFLTIDRNEITLDAESRQKGIEIQMDNSLLLQMGKTYRLEEQEEPGGALIAEIFTKSTMANNKVLCILRAYNYHKVSQGYLYLKDGDKAKFVTNFNITPQTTINKISILRPGNDWNNKLIVYPGETIELKIEGEALHKAEFKFTDAIDLQDNNLFRSENSYSARIQIPVNISKNFIEIINHGQKTGFMLKVSEYQIARPFDFIAINPGDSNHTVSAILTPIMYRKTIKDIAITFNENKIDEGKIYGKQYLSLTIRITDKKNNLIELRTIDNFVICPGEQSPRYLYYLDGTCSANVINLNRIISRKTYDLEDWSKIEITIKHQADKYKGDIESKTVEIYLQRLVDFDIDVSFPAGLLIKKQDETGYGSFGGISMAMIAQFSFYNPEKIARYRPYKIGVGFLALNAFDFSEKSNRDIGAVVLGSLYPTTRESRLSFPLFLGGGYFLDNKKWFYLIGPGIRVKL